jgi:hypothetical protein
VIVSEPRFVQDGPLGAAAMMGGERRAGGTGFPSAGPLAGHCGEFTGLVATTIKE